jgi:hypothetical protein
MALLFTDPNSAGPFVTFGAKDPDVKVFKLTFANFTTGNTDAVVGALAADASILRFETWLKTAFAGNGVTSPVISLGTASGGTQFASAVALTNTTGTFALVTPVTGIMQPLAYPLGADQQIWVRGGCSTGSPTSGELYLAVWYVR